MQMLCVAIKAHQVTVASAATDMASDIGAVLPEMTGSLFIAVELICAKGIQHIVCFWIFLGLAGLEGLDMSWGSGTTP